MLIYSPAALALKKGTYRHYKGNLYRVIDIVRHSETLEELVLYQALYDDYAFWVRPLEMFCSAIDYEGYEQPRFALVDL